MNCPLTAVGPKASRHLQCLSVVAQRPAEIATKPAEPTTLALQLIGAVQRLVPAPVAQPGLAKQIPLIKATRELGLPAAVTPASRHGRSRRARRGHTALWRHENRGARGGDPNWRTDLATTACAWRTASRRMGRACRLVRPTSSPSSRGKMAFRMSGRACSPRARRPRETLGDGGSQAHHDAASGDAERVMVQTLDLAMLEALADNASLNVPCGIGLDGRRTEGITWDGGEVDLGRHGQVEDQRDILAD